MNKFETVEEKILLWLKTEQGIHRKKEVDNFIRKNEKYLQVRRG